MTDQPGSSPWNTNVGPTPGPGWDAPTTPTPPSAPGAAELPPPPSGQSNRLKVVVAINAVLILVGAAVIAVVLLKGDDDTSNVALTDERRTTTSAEASTSTGKGDTSSTTSAPSTTAAGADPAKLAPKPTAVPASSAPPTQAPATTQAPVTLPPPTDPPPPPVPSPDDALGQIEATLTGFMAADSNGNVDEAMSYLAPPVDQWVVADQRNFSAGQLRADLSDPDSSFDLSLADGPTMAFGPEPTSDGGWTAKVNYTMNANGEYLSQEGGWKCVNNDQQFLDTLVAPAGGSPRISSHEQIGEPVKYC